MKHRSALLALLCLLASSWLAGCGPTSYARRGENQPGLLYQEHFVGGFAITSPASVLYADGDGVQVAFNYGQPPTTGDQLGQSMQASHLSVVDGYIASALHYYECQRTRLLLSSAAWSSYCPSTGGKAFANRQAFLLDIAAHLQEVGDNPLVQGYWVLDDWPLPEAGSARLLLQNIHALIQHYTAGRPAICGFGAQLDRESAAGWNDATAANFSPEGCDMVGLYIYAAVQPAYERLPLNDDYDWSMTELLPQIFASLASRGWRLRREPFIGIVQAFGGPRAGTPFVSVIPAPDDIESQSQAFCAAGAQGLAFYAWSDSGFGPSTYTPMDSFALRRGIRRGVEICRRYWR